MSWNTTQIISPATVRTLSKLAAGVEDRKLSSGIADAQRVLLQALGVVLYTMIEDADPVTDATLGGDTGLATLYDDHAKYFLAWRAKADSMPDLWAEPDRNGVFQRANEDHSTVSGSTLNVLTAKAAARADAHMNDMIAYLKELDPADPIRVAWDTATDGEKRRPAGRSNVSGRLSVRKHPWQQ